MKNLSFYYLFIQHIKKLHNEVGLDVNVYSTQGQTALTAVTHAMKESVWFMIVYCRGGQHVALCSVSCGCYVVTRGPTKYHA